MSVPRESDLGSKFPARIVIILTLCMTLNIYTLVNLFPYVGVMIKDLLELETTNELGYYAGYVASAFTFGRFISGYPLGQVTDSIGRKPIIISGLFSIMVLSVAFALSPTFGFAIGSRFILGITNGIAPALRITLREVCGDEHVMRGMAYLEGSKAVSLVLGTGIGGLLAQPALNYPSVFSESGVFGRYPFLLPNLIGSIAAFLLLPVVMLVVPETKAVEEPGDGTGGNSRNPAEDTPPRDSTDSGIAAGLSHAKGRGSLAYKEMTDRDGGAEELPRQMNSAPGLELQELSRSRGMATSRRGDCDGDNRVLPADKQQEPPGLWGPDGLLAVTHVKMILSLVCVIQASLIGFEEAYPLWALSTSDRGGLDWDVIDIGKVFFAAGAMVAVLQLGVLPALMKVVGLTRLQRIGGALAVLAFTSVPFAAVLSWNDSSLYVVSVASTFLIYCSMAMINLALAIASTTIVPAEMCGKLSGLFTSSESFGRFIGPAGFAVVFAWSISTSAPDWVDYQFVFFGGALAMLIVTFLAWETVTDENMAHKGQSSDVDVVDCSDSSMQAAVGGPGFSGCPGRNADMV